MVGARVIELELEPLVLTEGLPTGLSGLLSPDDGLGRLPSLHHLRVYRTNRRPDGQVTSQWVPTLTLTQSHVPHLVSGLLHTRNLSIQEVKLLDLFAKLIRAVHDEVARGLVDHPRQAVLDAFPVFLRLLELL